MALRNKNRDKSNALWEVVKPMYHEIQELAYIDLA